MKSLPVVVACLAAFVLVGCDHKLKMTVNNVTPETRDFAVGVGQDRPRRVATIPAGGTFKQTIKIPKDSLPTDLRWGSGDQRGRETIHAKQKKIVINLDGDDTIVTDGNAEIERRVERQTITDVKVRTVVE
ncbi:MAG: hypothetical protein FWE88_06735 [Phycisphaerae bacterium]|nr:hypothetical protein [Phycisphaerae bacterium]